MTDRTLAVSRRSLLQLALAGTITGPLLVACGTDEEGGAAPAAARRGGTLTVGFDNEPVGLDPAFSSQISSDRNLLNLFYDSLLRQDRDGSFQPALAEEWTYEGTEATFTLRQGVTFTDGTPLDAEAVAFNLRRVIDPATKSTKAAALKKVSAVDVVDASTVRITLSAFDPVLLVQLAHEPGMMASPTAVQAAGADFGRTPVGTGPYVLEDWTTKVSLRAERNPAYWRKDEDGEALPRLDAVVVRFITDVTVLRAEIATGGIQLLRVLPPEQFKQLEGDRAVTLDDVGTRRSYYVALNTTRAPFSDPEARRAFAMAIDRDAVGKVTAAGEYDLAPSFAVQGDWFYDGDLKSTEYDAAEAKSTAAAAGVDGTSVALLVRNREPDPTIAEFVQAQLAEAGFRAEVEPLELPTLLERMRAKDFDASILVLDVPRLDPSLTFDPYFASGAPNNWSGTQDPELDALLTEALSTDDQAQRKEAYLGVQQRVLDENYFVFLHQPRSPLIHRSDLQGIVLNTDGQWRLDEAHLA